MTFATEEEIKTSTAGPRPRARKVYFDIAAFSAAIHRYAFHRGLSYRQLANETGVSASTVVRMMKHGRVPDGLSMAALSGWAGINPSNFVRSHDSPALVATPCVETQGMPAPMSNAIPQAGQSTEYGWLLNMALALTDRGWTANFTAARNAERIFIYEVPRPA